MTNRNSAVARKEHSKIRGSPARFDHPIRLRSLHPGYNRPWTLATTQTPWPNGCRTPRPPPALSRPAGSTETRVAARGLRGAEAYYRWRRAQLLWRRVLRAKIATTTKVMRGSDGHQPSLQRRRSFAHHPLFSGAPAHPPDFVDVRVECEIALMLGADIAASGAPSRRDKVGAGGRRDPRFELIEDRDADYTQTNAASLIVEVAGTAASSSAPPIHLAQRCSTASPSRSGSTANRPAKVCRGRCANARLARRPSSPNTAPGLKAGIVVITAASFPRCRSSPGGRDMFSVA